MKKNLLDRNHLGEVVNRIFGLGAIVVLIVFLSATVSAQTPYVAPKPGPEHKKLAVLVGSWTTAGEAATNPFGPAEKWSGKFTWEWTPGSFAVVRHFDGKGSVTGENRGIEIIAYDGPAKTYTWYGVDNQAWTGLAMASIVGDTLTAFWNADAKGKTYKIRGTLKGLGNDRLTWVSEYSEDGKTWTAYFHATDTRVK